MIRNSLKVAVLSRFDVPGGSERRAVYLANIVRDLTGAAAILTDSPTIPRALRLYLDPRVSRFTTWKDDPLARKVFATLDIVVVILSNNHNFTRIKYWEDTIAATRTKRAPKLIFVVNFDLGAIEYSIELLAAFPSMHICLANTQLRQTMQQDVRFHALRRISSSVLPSPVDLRRFQLPKGPEAAFGSYAFPCSHKWNLSWPSLISNSCAVVRNMQWRLMGAPRILARRMPTSTATVCSRLFDIPVERFLQQLRVFVFFPAWDWQEAWSRSIAEALASGCPVIATDQGGNRDQIVHGQNGFLCSENAGMLEATTALAQDPIMYARMSHAASDSARSFSYERVKHLIAELLD